MRRFFVLFDLKGFFRFFFKRDMKVPAHLQHQPEFRLRFKETGKPDGGICCNGALAYNELINSSSGNA